jgi:5'-3' exonuclease
MKKKVFDKREFNNRFNFKPNDNRVVLYKTIRGDSVDNIPAGIPNFPTKKLVRLVEDYKDIFDVIDNLEIIPYLTPTWREKIRKNEPRLRLNHQLVSFIPISDDYLQQFTFACKFRPKNLAVLYESLQFTISKIDERVVDYAQPTHHKAQEEPKDSFFRVPKAYRK